MKLQLVFDIAPEQAPLIPHIAAAVAPILGNAPLSVVATPQQQAPVQPPMGTPMQPPMQPPAGMPMPAHGMQMPPQPAQPVQPPAGTLTAQQVYPAMQAYAAQYRADGVGRVFARYGVNPPGIAACTPEQLNAVHAHFQSMQPA